MDGEIGKLRWRCRRGMKELDLLLTRYVDEHYRQAAAAEQAAFRRLLELQDPVINDYVLGRDAPGEPDLRSLIARLVLKRPNDV
jgi:antitoxin CptB